MVLGAIARLIVRDMLDIVDPKDRGYFRESREARFGMTLEAVQEGRDARVPEFRALLTPARLVLDSSSPSTPGHLARRGGADVRGLHPVRHAAMAALRQPVRAAGGRRSGSRVARADAGSVRRDGTAGASRGGGVKSGEPRRQPSTDFSAPMICSIAPRAAGVSASAFSTTKSWMVPLYRTEVTRTPASDNLRA